MGTKRKSFRLPEQIASELEELANLPEYASEAFIVTKALETFFNVLRKKEPPTSTEDLSLQLDRALKEIERLNDVLRHETECLSRFEDQGINYCAKYAPKIIALPTLKICKACRFKITKETLTKDLPVVQYYYSCGATEKLDEKTGVIWLFSQNRRCPKWLRGKWHTLESCRSEGCPLLKTYLAKKK